MGLYFFALRGALALLVLCISVSGEKIGLPNSKSDQGGLGRPLQSKAGEDARQTEGVIDRSPRHKMTRHSRRFSRPHLLINPTKAPTVKQNADEVLENKPSVVQQIVTEIKATPDSVEGPEPKHVSKEETTRVVGGSEDSTPTEVSLSSVPPNRPAEAHRNDSHNSEHANDIPDKSHMNRTRRLKHKVRKPSPSVVTTLPRRLNYILSSLYTLRQHNGTLCNSIYNITGSTYVEYIRPYMAYLHQRASDAYDAQLEQQSVVKVKGKVNKEAHRKGPTNRNGKKWSMPKLSFRKKPSPVQRIANNFSVAATANNDRIQISSDINAQEVKMRQALLEQNITFLSNIVASKDATVRELMQRLSLLEQELSTLRQSPLVVSPPPAIAAAETPLAAPVVPNVESIVHESEGSIGSNDIHSVRQDASELVEKRTVHTIGDMVPSVDVTYNTSNTMDAYELLQHVLNALYIVGSSTDTVANNNLSESGEVVAVRVSTDQLSMVETSVVSVHPDVTDRASIVYPSIIDSVIAEREVQEQYMQRLCDAAAVIAVVLPCCIETSTISVQVEDGADIAQKEAISGNTDTIPADTMTVNDYDSLNPLQSVVESLESQIAELNNELLNISAQLCHYRGQHFAPLDTIDDDMTDDSTSKHGWFW